MLQDKHPHPVGALEVDFVGGSHRSQPVAAGVVVVDHKKAPELVPGIAAVVAAAADAAGGILETRVPRPVHHTNKDPPPAVGAGIVAVATVPMTDKRRVAVRGHHEREEPAAPRDRARWDLRREPTHRCLRMGRSRAPVRTFPEGPRPIHRYQSQNYLPKDQRWPWTSHVELSWIAICHSQG